jgi:hypothetical protein
MSEFLELVQANGVEGLVTGLIVLVTVFLLNKGGVVVGGPQKQTANVVLSILLAGLSVLEPESAEALVASIASIGSALVFHLIQWLGIKAGVEI